MQLSLFEYFECDYNGYYQGHLLLMNPIMLEYLTECVNEVRRTT